MTCGLRPVNTEKEPATSSALPDQDGDEFCECLGTFEEDIRMGNGVEWAMCVCVVGGSIQTASAKLQ